MKDSVPLVLVAGEIDEPIDALAQRLDAEVMLGVAGVRHVDVGLAERLIEQHRDRQQAQREQAQLRREQDAARRAAQAARAKADRDRVRAIQARQQIDVDGDLSASAFATLTADDESSRLARAGRRMDEYLGGRDGTLTYRRVSPDTQEAH